MLYPCPKPIKEEKKARRYLRPIRKGFRAALEIECNRIWGDIVLLRCNYRCQHVDETGFRCRSIAVDPHHIIRRVFKAIKFNIHNGMGICRYHHELGTTRLFLVAVRVFGEIAINKLKEMAQGEAPTEEDLVKIKQELTVVREKIKKEGYHEEKNNQ